MTVMLTGPCRLSLVDTIRQTQSHAAAPNTLTRNVKGNMGKMRKRQEAENGMMLEELQDRMT